MPNKLGFYLHSSQDQHGLWSLVERIKPPVVLIHMESKDDILLTQMRQFRSPNTFVIGRLGMDGNEQGAFLNDPDPEAAGDVGWLTEVEPQSQEDYWTSLQWYNDLMVQDSSVLGACLYQVGWTDKWKSFRLTGNDNNGNPIRIMDWVAERLA